MLLIDTSRTFQNVRLASAKWANRDFMMGWTPPDGIGVAKVEVLSTT